MRRSIITLLVLSLAVLVTALCGSSNAQAVYGSISGTVTDPNGAVVSGATVVITSVERKTSDSVTTNDSGLYVKERLLPGNYEVKIEAPGFKSKLISTVLVNVDAQTKVDAALEAGQVTDTVTVTAGEGQLLKTDRADVATTFQEKQVTDLPILDRNFTKLLLLTPGTQQLQWQHAASENPQGSTQIMVNGQHFSGTGYQLDGTENRDPILGIIVINPNFEAVGETKITSQNYDAEFGQAIAGVVSVQTKSGTNQIHGSVFEFRQNDVLQARNPYTQFQDNPLTGKAIPDTLKNQFGGSIGGPIIKDKFFYFGDYQGTRSKVGGSRLLTVPTLAARIGDLSAYGVNIFDPQTGVQFPGNVIPNGRLSQQALNILKLIPPPNAPGTDNGTRNNFVAGGSEKFDNDTFDVRIDNRLTSKLNVFGRYSFADFTRNGPQAFGAGGGQQLVNLGGNSKVRNHSVAVGFDYTLSPSALIDFRFGFFKYGVNVLPSDFGTTPASDAGIPGLNLDNTFTSGLFEGFVQGDRGFTFGSGLDEFAGRCNCPLDEQEKQFQFVGNLLKTWGNHTFKFGVDIRRALNLRVPSDNHRSGELSFSQNRTGRVVNGQLQAEGLGLATFLIGDVTFFKRFVSTSTDARERQWRHFYYGQDTWRVTPKLTVAYGLRLDVINPQTVNDPGNGGFVDTTTGEVIVAGAGGNDLNGGVENSLNFAPRLGIAYQMSDKTVVRAGYGRSYDIGVFGSVFGHTVTQNLPVLAIQNLSAASDIDRVFTLAQGPPAFTNFFGLTAPPNQGGVPNAALPANGRFFLPNGVTPRVVNLKQTLPTVDAWNVTVQHELTKTMSVQAAYVGNKGTHVFCGNNPDCEGNQASIAQGLPPEAVPKNNRRFFFNKFGWTQDVLLYSDGGDNHYNSFQTKFTKRFVNAYSILAHYTYQRSSNYDRDYFFIDRSINYGPSDFDRTHVFVFSQVAELPIGRNRRYFGNVSKGWDYLVGGWQFNSNTTIESGLPFNVGYDTSGISDTGPNRPDIVGDAKTGGPRNRFFDPTVFAKPAVGTFGNLPRNDLRGPNYWRTDASLFKKFRFTERKELEFRIEVVNLFNHVNLDQPDTFIGNPASPNAHAGVISNTAYGGTDPQRNLQWALKFKF